MRDYREWLRADQPVDLGLFIGVFIHWLRPMYRLNKNELNSSMVYEIKLIWFSS